MTPDQIRQIAEEYIAYKYPKSYKEMKPYALKNAIKVVSEIIEYFAERFCLVERSKVVEEMEAAKWHKETAEGMNIQYGKGMANGQIMVLENLFGSETFNKKEE